MGHYVDTQGRYILKIGTTNNLKRRKAEHTRNYHKAPDYILPPGKSFQFDWSLPLSKYNTLRYEDKNRKIWQEKEVGAFVRNDRFCCPVKPDKVEITIRKTYVISL